MSDTGESQTSEQSAKKRWENSIVPFGLGVGLAAVVAAISAYSFVRTEIDARVDERVQVALPAILSTDPVIEILREQREQIQDAQSELAQYRSDTRASLELTETRVDEAVADVKAQEAQALQATETLQARIRDLNQTVDDSRVLDQIDARADAALRNLDEKLIARLEFPADAVVAFAKARPRGMAPNGPTDDPCPQGWTRYQDADGRFIIGVGPDDSPFKEGGAREHVLAPIELPGHQHNIVVSGAQTNRLVDSSRFDSGSGNSPTVHDQGKRHPYASPQTLTTESTGGNAAHNNLPPYIALYFCKKSG